MVLGVSAKFARACREAAERAGTAYIGVSLANAPSVVVRERPDVVLLTEDVYSFDPERFDALADGVGAELVIVGSEDEPMTRVARRIVRAVLSASQRRRNTEARPTMPAPATPTPTARIQVRPAWHEDQLAPHSAAPAVTAPPTAEAALLEASFTTRELRGVAPRIEVDEMDDFELEVRPSDPSSGEARMPPISAPIAGEPTHRPVSGVRDRRPPLPTIQFTRVIAGRKP
ncbi:MAG: hypothetical protein WKG00_21680 [Polyangiaceae bacterium]